MTNKLDDFREFVTRKLPRIVSVQSLANGVGKTQFCTELAINLAELGGRVLVVDLCADGALSQRLTGTDYKRIGDALELFTKAPNWLKNREHFPRYTLLGMPSKSGHSRVPICRVESNDLFDAIDNLARLKRHYDVCLFDCPNDFQLLVHITTISHRIHFFERLEVGQMFEDWRVPLFDNFPAKAVPEIFVEDDRANASALHQTG